MIWMDKDYNNDPYQKSAYVSPLADDVEMPCDACPLKNECAVSGKECVALRGWYVSGKDCTTELLMKSIKVKDKNGKGKKVRVPVVPEVLINNVGRLLR